MPTPFNQQPSLKVLQTLNFRNIFADPSTAVAAPVFSQIDGTLSRDTLNTSDVTVLQAGLLMGKITTGGLYRPAVIGVTSGAAVNTATSVTVPAPVATEVARLITQAGASVNLVFVGPPTVAGVVAKLAAVACSAASGTTLTVAAIGAAIASGSLVCAADGSDLPTTILANPYGLPVTLSDNSTTTQFLSPYVSGGDIVSSMIIGYANMDASVQTYVKTKLGAVGTFRFSDNR